MGRGWPYGHFLPDLFTSGRHAVADFSLPLRFCPVFAFISAGYRRPRSIAQSNRTGQCDESSDIHAFIYEDTAVDSPLDMILMKQDGNVKKKRGAEA